MGAGMSANTTLEAPRGAAVAVDALLREAIDQRRVIAFDLAGHPRVAEPHDYGLAGGAHRLLFYQVGGGSSSGNPHGWRSVDIRKMTNVRLLDQQFDGKRATPSGRHRSWESIIASVSLPPGPVPQWGRPTR